MKRVADDIRSQMGRTHLNMFWALVFQDGDNLVVSGSDETSPIYPIIGFVKYVLQYSVHIAPFVRRFELIKELELHGEFDVPTKTMIAFIRKWMPSRLSALDRDGDVIMRDNDAEELSDLDEAEEADDVEDDVEEEEPSGEDL